MPLTASASFTESQALFRNFLVGKGLRVTGQRMAILEAVFNLEDTFTADALLSASVALDDSISRATLYRTLPLLLECGLIREIDVGSSAKYYKRNSEIKPFQAQVICSDCEKIFEVDAPFMEWYGKTVSERLGLEVGSQRLQVRAKCPKHSGGECKRS